MPNSCAVPGCGKNFYGKSRGQDKDDSARSFKFPRDEKRKQAWIRAIHRDNFYPTDNNVVCIHHFHSRHIISADTVTRPDGTEEIVPRKRFRLTADAVPMLFIDSQPSYLSSDLPPERKDPEDRRAEIDNRDEVVFQEWLQSDKIESFEQFRADFQKKSLLEFLFQVNDDNVWFFRVNFQKNPKITTSIQVSKDLSIRVFLNDSEIHSKQYEAILDPELLCKKWSTFETLLSQLNNSFNISDTLSSTDKAKQAALLLDSCIDELKSSAENVVLVNKLQFLKDQIDLSISTKIQYKSSTFIWACALFLPFPGAYNIVRNSKTLTLPHPTYIRRVTADVKSDEGLKRAQVNYLKYRCGKLQEQEKKVNVLLDEIGVKSDFTYRAGRVRGAALTEGNEVELATKVQAFQMVSLFSKYEDVIGLYPVKNASAELLKKWTLEVIKVLTELGFTITSLICDNYKMNRSMYTLLLKEYGSSESDLYINNPYRPTERIHLLFDTIHLGKSFRNNWCNQKDAAQTLVFPSFENSNLIMSAKLQDVKKVYFSEENKIVKLAPNLSKKVLFPSSFERQNVLIAFRLFDEKTCAALRAFFPNDQPVNGTYHLVNIFGTWIKIINVRSPRSGYNLRDSHRDPIRSVDDENVKFLEDFCHWLEEWKKLEIPACFNLPKKGGKLTDATYSSLLHTTQGLIAVIKYTLPLYKCPYLLLGIFSTDPMEGTFGRFRQLCGSNYNITVSDVMDADKKLKSMKLLQMQSASSGTFKLIFFPDEDLIAEEEIDAEVYASFSPVLEDCDSMIICSADKVALYYIAGYVSHNLLKYTNPCQACYEIVALNKTFSIEACDAETSRVSEYLRNLSRGGLKHPTEFMLEIIGMTYILFSTLISDKYEKAFIKCKYQRSLLKRLAIAKSDEIFEDMDHKCDCGKLVSKILSRAIHTTSNVFINNYCKMVSDNYEIKKASKRNERKKKILS